jgi:hypothetical protein
MRECETSLQPLVLKGFVLAVMAFALLVSCTRMGVSCGAPERSRREKCLSNIRQLSFGLMLYAMDWDGVYPWHVGSSDPAEAWCDVGVLFGNYIDDIRVFLCPSSKDPIPKPREERDIHSDDAPEPPDVEVVEVALLHDMLDMFGRGKQLISYGYCYDSRENPPRSWTESAPLSSVTLVLADKKAGTTIRDEDVELANHKGKGRNAVSLASAARWVEGPDPLDPNEVIDAIGKPGAADYSAWWSDPPFYGEE